MDMIYNLRFFRATKHLYKFIIMEEIKIELQ